MENAKDVLKKAIISIGGTTMNMTVKHFKNWAKGLPKDSLEILLDKHRSDREFYKKILAEDRRETHPNSHRYSDAIKQGVIIKTQGEILVELVKTK